MRHDQASPKILVIRRDNIGDLVCTTPLIAALRQRFPQGWIGALVNSYNAPVLEGNPDVDQVFIYTKAKHRAPHESLSGVLWQRYRMMRVLRRMRIDDIIIATTSPQPRTLTLARWLKPQRVIGYGQLAGLDVVLPPDDQNRHEVEDVFRVAALYGIAGSPPACCVHVSRPAAGSPASTFTLGIHISARKPSQRWPAERFAKTIQTLAAQHPAMRFMLLWSPGAEDNPLHPGDDAKAHAVLTMTGDAAGSATAVVARPTHTLPELIAALTECDALFCADGGAMHLAAGLGLPVVALFGQSSVQRWRPWGVPSRTLQNPTHDVRDIGVEAVVAAFSALRADIQAPSV